MQRSKAVLLTFGLALFALLVWGDPLTVIQSWPASGANPFARLDKPTPEEIARWRVEEIEMQRAMKGGQFHLPLKLYVEFPGLQQPVLYDPREENLPDSTRIAGLEINGESCAFVLSAMKNPSRHIVNLMMGQKAISVAYCDLVDCVRVVQSDSQTPVPLHVGGLDINNQLVLLLKDKRYGQESAELPLKNYAFTRTTLGEWMLKFPNSRVCIPTKSNPDIP